MMTPRLDIARWKYDKDWVYSITYDEALADLARFVIPVHEELGLPGHVEVVAGHIGEVRNLGASSFNGMRHMNASELRGLLAMGWGVGCHSWSHGMVMDDPELELRQAREAIEDAIGRPVTVYTAPGSNANLTPDVLALLPDYGYLAGVSITDDINYAEGSHPPPHRGREQAPAEGPHPLPNPPPQGGGNQTPPQRGGKQACPPCEGGLQGVDLLWVNRIPIHERYWGVFDSAFDAHKRIRQAQLAGGWIVDYCHCPLPQPMHDYKDCTAAHHRERLEAIVSEGGDACWYANPDEVVDYRYMRRHSRVVEDGPGRWIVRIDALPERVQCRELTFKMDDASSTRTLEVADGTVIEATGGSIG